MTTNSEELDNDADSSEPAIMPAEARITFARKNDLVKVMRKVDKSVDKAIEFLESVVLDTAADLKVRISAAQFIVDKKIQISDNISRDSLARSIAESRLLLAERTTQQKRIKDVSNEDEGYSQPQYCPDLILDHSAIKSM